MERKNCWEVRKCGRQSGGKNTKEFGVCPVSQAFEYHGINGGICGGRSCWAITGTVCDGKRQGTFADKFLNCLECDFLKQVNEEEGRYFVLSPTISAQ